MKKIFWIWVAASLIGCTTDDDCTPNVDTPVEIKINAGVQDVTAKGPVSAGTAINAVFVASGTSNSYNTPQWSDTLNFTASTSPAALSFTPKRYYPTNGDTVYMKGFYPVGTISGNTVSFSATDGSVDLLLTNEVKGTRASSALSFPFNHQLTQLQFKFVVGTGFPTGKTVTTLVIKNAQTYPTQLNLNTGALTYSAGNITFTGKSYPIGNISADPVTDYPMVAPGSPVILGITSSEGVTYPDLTVPTLVPLKGNSHIITITFNLSEITATATVANWVPGAGGGSSVN